MSVSDSLSMPGRTVLNGILGPLCSDARFARHLLILGGPFVLFSEGTALGKLHDPQGNLPRVTFLRFSKNLRIQNDCWESGLEPLLSASTLLPSTTLHD